MRQAILGVFVGLILASVGVYWYAGVAQVQELAPPPPEPEEPAPAPEELPLADPADLEGPAPPEASELTREEKRFFRYDRDRDRIITRNEMLSTRSNLSQTRQGRQQSADFRGMGGDHRQTIRRRGWQQ